MIIGVVFIPAAPLLCPDVDIEDLLVDERDASIELVLEFVLDAQQVIVIGSGERTHWFNQGGIGSTRGFGGLFDYSLGSGSERLPQVLTIAAAVLAGANWTGSVVGLEVAPDSNTQQREVLGREVAAKAAELNTLVVVVGDGSATRTEKAPGYVQPDAASFDEAMARAINEADTHAILDVDQEQADRLWCRGIPAWQVVAHAVDPMEGALILESAPFGVNYLVASWRP
ncbi:MAG: hypothetical protein F2923_05630 [Actinobacteria bacterium]|uniref:Unannotated protein n=1 Tax=freshwater metagenome TaxID=449393 RepID=A0A6J7SGF5_9ZZZZ|nr:hypothetical protein [Actinomycetota bacterium]MTB28104.1 hypothetical protein [Actinomycetota bacterium]